MTVKQKQHLLAFLGYYRAEVDGIWGAQSRQATILFQKAYMDRSDGEFDTQTQQRIREVISKEELAEEKEDWPEIRFFTRSEFSCRCGNCGGFPVEPDRELVKLAEQVRNHFGKPVLVSSGVRCAAHNAAVGGVSNSRHLSGKAMDFAVRGCGAKQVLSYLQQLPQLRYAYAIDETYVHMDIA